MSYKDSCSRIALAVCLLAGFAAPVAAQTKTNDNGAASGRAGGNSVSLQEVVVTAQKRSELLSKTPLAITVIGQQTLDATGARSFTDAARTLPNVSIGLGQKIAIRGIGTSVTKLANGTVAFHTDGIFQNGKAQANASQYDIQRIEVLRGPQGTLYGRNATAGVVNVITSDANLQGFETFGDVSYQRFNDFTARGVINVPVTDNFALRLTAYYEKSDSWKVDEAGNHPPEQDYLNLRLALKYQPTDNLSWDGRLEWSDNDTLQAVGVPVYSYNAATRSFVRAGNPTNQAFLGSNWTQDGLVNSSFGFPYSSQYKGVKRNEANTQNFDNIAVRSKLRFDVSDNLSITYLLGYLHVDTHPGRISGLQALQIIYGDHSKDDDWSHEVDFNYESDNFKSVVGVYAYDHRNRATNQLTRIFGPRTLAGNVLDYSAPLIDTSQTDLAARDTTRAIFGQGTFSVTDQLRLTGGARYNWDRARSGAYTISQCPFGSGSSATDPNAATIPSFIPGLGGRPVCSTFVALVPGTFYLNRAIPEGQKSFQKFSWKGSVEYDVDPKTLAYATVATGYKAGGIGDQTLVGDARFFKPETDINYEAGVRTRLFDDRVSLNLIGFWTDYKNLQISFVNPANPAVQIFRNAGRSRSRGLEFEYAWALTQRDRIEGFATILDAKFRDFPSADPLTNVPQNFAGNYMSGAPKYSARINYAHIFDLGDAGTITPTAQFFYQAKSYQSFANTIATRVPEYTRSDLIVRYENTSKSYFVEGFVNNIEDRKILTGQIPISGVEIGYYSAPRTFGVRIGFHH